MVALGFKGVRVYGLRVQGLGLVKFGGSLQLRSFFSELA